MEASNLLFVCVFITSGQTPAHGWSFSQSTKALKWKIDIPVASCGKILNVQSRHLVFPSCVVKSSRLEMTSAAQRNTNAQKGRWCCGSMRFTWALEILKEFSVISSSKKINPAEAVLANFTHCWRWMLLHTDWWVATLETETPAFALRHSKRTSSEWGPLHTLIICLPGMSIQPLRPCPPCHWANRSAEALYEFYPGTIGTFTCPSSPSDIIHPHNVWICLRTSSAFS